MLTWGYSGPGDILFGEGAVRELGKRAAALGSRAFVVTGRDPDRAEEALKSLRAADLTVGVFPSSGEPTFEALRSALAAARRFSGEGGAAVPGQGFLVVGVGGGSALDLAKGTGILLANPGDPLDYAEVIGAGKPFANPSLPVIAVPTTAGTGSEATKNAVFADRNRGVKVSLRSPSMFPRLALVDPGLCFNLPPDVTAFTGMDALTQVLEPFVSVKANPVTDALCSAALAEVVPALRKAFRDGADREARAVLSRVSLFGGLALGNSGLGAVHGLAGPLGGRLPVPHGAACAAALAPAVRVNLRALRERAPDSPALGRYDRAARLLSGRDETRAGDLPGLLEDLVGELVIPGLRDYGLAGDHIPSLAADAAASSSMKGNPVLLTPPEIEEILRSSL